MKRKFAVGLVAATAAATTLLGITSASAAGPGGSEACPSGSVCLYYNSPGVGWGSFEHWSPGQYSDLSLYRFGNWGNGSGYGQTVYNNAASLVNNTGYNVAVCVYTNLAGCSYFGSGYSGALPGGLHNNDASMYTY
jgi:hypothetical protein